MAQISTVIKGDPISVVAQLNGLASANEIQVVEKTYSSGEYLVIYDNAGGASQLASVLKGDPTSVQTQINLLIGAGSKTVLSDTFSSGAYILVAD